MSIAWPSNVPPPLADGTLQPAKLMKPASMDGKIVRPYLTAANPTQAYEAHFLLSASEWAYLLYFIQVTSGYGVNWFGASWLDTLLGTGYVARIANPPQYTMNGLLYSVTLPVEIQLSAYAVSPVNSSWQMSNWSYGAVVQAPYDWLSFHWSAATEATATGSNLINMSSLHNSGATFLTASGAPATAKMQLVLSQRAAVINPSNVNVYQFQISSSASVLQNCSKSSFSMAVVVPFGVSSDAFTFAHNNGSISITKGSISVSNFGNSVSGLPFTVPASNRACIILTMDWKGYLNIYVNGVNIYTVASAWVTNSVSNLQIGLNSSQNNNVHEIYCWNRTLTYNEAVATSTLMQATWSV